MSATADSLRQLHRIHQQLADLRGQLQRGPELVRAHQAKTRHLQEEAKRIEQLSKTTRMAADDKNLQLKSKEGRIQDLRGKLNSCTTNKEYQALQEQIAAAEMACSVLQDEILESLEKVDEFQTLVALARKKREEAQADLVRISASVQEKEGRLNAQLERVLVELHEAERKLPVDFKSDYDRIVQARGEDAMAPVEGESCSGCYRKLTPNTLSKLTMAQVIFCQSCGRMLYMPENTSPTA